MSRHRPGETGGIGQVLAGERKPIEQWRPFDVVQFLERMFREDSEEARSARRRAVNKAAMTGAFLRDAVALDQDLAMSSLLLSRLQAERLAAELKVGMTGARISLGFRVAAAAARDKMHGRVALSPGVGAAASSPVRGTPTQREVDAMRIRLRYDGWSARRRLYLCPSSLLITGCALTAC